MRRGLLMIAAVILTATVLAHEVGSRTLMLAADVVASCGDDACSSESEPADSCPPDCGSCHDCTCCLRVLGRVDRAAGGVARAPASRVARVASVDEAPACPDPLKPLRVPRSA